MLVYGLGLAMLLCLPLVCHGATDLTREDGASGEFVVDATLDQIEWTCIFTPDYLMMKRLAWVETEYGDLMAEGGIWKVGSENNVFLSKSTFVGPTWLFINVLLCLVIFGDVQCLYTACDHAIIQFDSSSAHNLLVHA